MILFVIFLFLSAFFSCSEMTLLSLNKFELRKLIRVKHYKKLRLWIKTPSWFITGILLGNNISNIGFGTVCSFYFLKYAQRFNLNSEAASFFTFIFAALIILMFGEIIPKNIGKMNAPKTIHILYKPLLFFMYLFSPVIELVSFAERCITGKKISDVEKFTIDDLHRFVIMVRQEGIIKTELENMIHSFLELKKKRVEEIMTPRDKIEAIDVKTTGDIFERTHFLGRSRIPVYRKSLDNIEGILNARDLLAGIRLGDKFDITKFLRNPIFVNKNEKIENVFNVLRKKRKHLALVKVGKKIAGLVTLEDILEEITGEILDEYDLKREQ
ncbi:hemolysin family protein [bacterium]